MESQSKQQLTDRQLRRHQYWNTYRNSKKKHLKSQDSEHEPATKRSLTETNKTAEENKEDSEKKRYILFVGNLPFTVAVKEVKRHFRCAGGVVDFRLMTKKSTEESKGCGFLEFDNAGSMQKALNLHHSVLGGRKINVEVTCGGGGKGKHREKKLENKKQKLIQARRKKSSKLKTRTDDAETKSAPKISLQTDDKQTSSAVQSSPELHSGRIREKSTKRTDFIKGVGKRKHRKSGSDGGRKWLKKKDRLAVSVGKKRKLNDQSASGFHKRSRNKMLE